LNHPVPCLAALACAAVLGGCGGNGEESAPPTLPSGLASDLASRSDAIADAYAAGDVCGAARQADELLGAVNAAIKKGRVPMAFRQPLTATANELVNEINCPEEGPTPPRDEDSDCDELVEQKDALEEERKETKGKAKGRHRELDEQINALEEQIEACQEAVDHGGDEEEDDD
jgi:hypothetical protein